jgi:hypothetical protein
VPANGPVLVTEDPVRKDFFQILSFGTYEYLRHENLEAEGSSHHTAIVKVVLDEELSAPGQVFKTSNSS